MENIFKIGSRLKQKLEFGTKRNNSMVVLPLSVRHGLGNSWSYFCSKYLYIHTFAVCWSKVSWGADVATYWKNDLLIFTQIYLWKKSLDSGGQQYLRFQYCKQMFCSIINNWIEHKFCKRLLQQILQFIKYEDIYDIKNS